jgi:hypothetical protein
VTLLPDTEMRGSDGGGVGATRHLFFCCLDLLTDNSKQLWIVNDLKGLGQYRRNITRDNTLPVCDIARAGPEPETKRPITGYAPRDRPNHENCKGVHMVKPIVHQKLARVTLSNVKRQLVDQDLTDRMITSLVFDVTQLADDAEQVKLCVYNIARQRGLVKEDVERT